MGLRRSGALVGATLTLGAAGLTGCAPAPAGPDRAAATFIAAFARRDTAAAAAQTDQPERARVGLAAAWNELGAHAMTASTGPVRYTGDAGTVGYTYEWQLPHGRLWKYTGTLRMGRSNGAWSVRWSATDINPRLGADQTLAVRSTAAPRAGVHVHGGGNVLVPGVVHAVRLNAAAVSGGAIVPVADRIAAILHRFDPTLTGQSIAEAATAVTGDYTVMLLRDDDFHAVAAPLSVLGGVSFADRADLIAPDSDFAPAVLPTVRAAVLDAVDGQAGWSVVTVSPDGADTDVLTETPPRPAPSFELSLDRAVQDAAQRAVDTQTKQTMMVVLRPSTGAILALAQNAAADRVGTPATTGEYPPGSTFKIVTAAAAMGAGLAPDAPVPCPGSMVIGQRTVPNYDDFALGTVPLSTAFAHSCNTSFAKLASEMRPLDLRTAASRLGIIADYTMDGVSTAAGSVPAADDRTVRTEDGFGQGRILMSPFAMAVAAATVAHGSGIPAPYLIVGRPATVTGDRPAIAQSVIAGLRRMMREVVTDGTGRRIADQGEVYGKTGEAEFDGGSHAWFVGYRGDLAFATLIVDGGSSDYAVGVTRDLLVALGPDQLGPS